MYEIYFPGMKGTSVAFAGAEYTLSEDPHCDEPAQTPFGDYPPMEPYALAVDSTGDDCIIYWYVDLSEFNGNWEPITIDDSQISEVIRLEIVEDV